MAKKRTTQETHKDYSAALEDKVERLIQFIKNHWPGFFIAALAFLFFSPFWIMGELYVPIDILNDHSPWLDLKQPVLSWNHELFDVSQFFWPQDLLYNEWIHKGVIPLWNPTIYLGHPMVGSGQAPLFYLPRMLAHVLFPAGHAVTLLIALHVPLAGGLFYLWLRDRGFTQPGACIGATTFMLNAQMTTWLEYQHAPLICSWLGLQLWLIDRACGDRACHTRIRLPRYVAWPLLGVVWAQANSGGHLQYGLNFSALVSVYAVWRAVRCPRPLLSLVSLAGCLALMFSMMAPSFLPALELMEYCQRAPIDLVSNATPLKEMLITLLCPDVWGNPSWHYSMSRCDIELVFPEFACFVGLVPLILALSFLFQKKDREAHFWTVVLFLVFPIACATPPYLWLSRHVELLSLLVPGRVLLWLGPSVGYLAGRAIESPECWKRAKRLMVATAIAWVIILAVIFSTISSFSRYTEYWKNARPIGGANGLQVPRGAAVKDSYPFCLRAYHDNPQMYLPIILALLSIAVLSQQNKSTGWKQGALCLLAVVDTFYFGVHFNPHFSAARLLQEPPSISKLRELTANTQERVEPLETAPFDSLAVVGLRRVAGYESLFPRRLYYVFSAMYDAAVQNMRYVDIKKFVHPILSSLSLRYVISAKGVPVLPKPWRSIYSGEDADIYENPRCLPRAYWVSQWTALPTFLDIIMEMEKPTFFAGKVYIEAPTEAGQEKVPLVVERVQMEELTPQHIRLRHKSRTAGLVVVTDSYYVGWRAILNGKPSLLLAANGCVRAVPVDAGENEIDMIFEPPSLWKGAKLCAAGATFVFGCVIVFFLRLGISRNMSLAEALLDPLLPPESNTTLSDAEKTPATTVASRRPYEGWFSLGPERSWYDEEG